MPSGRFEKILRSANRRSRTGDLMYGRLRNVWVVVVMNKEGKTTVQSEVWSMVALQEDKLKRTRINHYAIHMTALNMERQPGRLRGIMTRLTAAMPSRPAAAELPA